MLTYFCTSLFSGDMVWEDFLPKDDDSFPSITVSNIFEEDGVKINILVPEFFKDNSPDAGNWYDAYVPEFSIENIKAIIAEINGTTPEKINIEWLGTAQAC